MGDNTNESTDGLEKCGRYLCEKDRRWQERLALAHTQRVETLADHTIYPPPALPTGHPFSNIEFLGYWTSTEHEDYTMSAWDVNFDYGIVGNDFKINTNFVWCVRDNAK